MKKLLTILILVIANFTFAQKVELTVQTGHSSAITDVKFSPFDDFIASASSDHKVIIWDFSTGKQYKVLLGHKDVVTCLSFHPDNEFLISASLDSTVKVWNYLTGELVKTIVFKSGVESVSFSSTGDFFVAAGEYLDVYNFENFTKSRVGLNSKVAFTCVELSSDNKLLFIGGKNERYSYLVDIEKREVIKRFNASAIAADFDEYEKALIVSTNSGIAFSYNYVEQTKKSTTTDWMLTNINDVVCDSAFIYLADDYGNIRVIEKDKWFQSAVFKGKFYKIRSIAKSNDGRFLAAGSDAKTIVVWDLKTQRVVKSMKGLVNQINDLAFSKDGKSILVVYEDGSMRKSDLVTNQTITNKVALNSELLTKVATFSIVKIISFEDNEPVLDVLFKQSHLDKEGIFDKLDQYKVKWDFIDNLIDVEKIPKMESKYESYITDLKYNTFQDNLYFQSEVPKSDVSDSLNMQVSIEERELVFKHLNSGNEYVRFDAQHTDLLSCVEINEKFGFVASGGWDGMIRFWDINTSELMTVFGAFGDGQFVYVNPEGYYFSSKNALSYIGFSLDNQVFSYDQFDLKYNRPDIVIQNLPYFDDFYEEAYLKAYQKRLDKLGLAEEEVSLNHQIPELEILNDLNQHLSNEQLIIKLKCTEGVHELDRLNLFVNGVPEFGIEGKKLTGKSFSEDISIKLNSGNNLIQIYVTNSANVSSLKQSFKVQGPNKSKKSKLYLLSIGVSKYEQSNYNLSYAAKDAKDIGTLFPIFTKHQVEKKTVLIDSAVTKESIQKLTTFMAEAGEDDIVVLFVAGHGVLDDNLDYFFAPHDMDFQDPKKNGIPFSMFDEILENTKCRKKIMFLDACHSGEIDKDEVVKTFVSEDEENKTDLTFRRVGKTIKNLDDINTFELQKALFADMRLNNGATVISSSGGSEYAIEGDQWKNGVFTYVLLSGLYTKEADRNKDKRVTISELQAYIQNGVNERTSGMQTPTSRVENLNYDFVIAKKWSD